MADPTSLESLKILIGAFGGSGLAFFAAFVMFKAWKETLAQKDAVLTARVEALERSTLECARDRTALHSRMFDLQRGIISTNTEVLHKVLSQLDPTQK